MAFITRGEAVMLIEYIMRYKYDKFARPQRQTDEWYRVSCRLIIVKYKMVKTTKIYFNKFS